MCLILEHASMEEHAPEQEDPMKYQKLKSFTASLIAVVLCTECLPIAVPTAAEEYSETADGVTYTYEIADGEATLTGCSGYGSTLTIPDTLGGAPLCAIGDYVFLGAENLTSVVVPDSVYMIGASAFSGSSLEEIQLSQSLLYIDIAAFKGSSLKTVNFPDSLLEIADRAFYETQLSSVVLPDGLLAMGEEAFENCDSLTSVVLPSAMVYCGDEAFMGCNQLTQVTIPEGLTMLGDYMFSGCGFTEMTLPAHITDPGIFLFRGCPITSLIVEEGVTSLPHGLCRNNQELTQVSLPETLVEIGKEVFANCQSLTSIDIPASVLSIGAEAFCDDYFLADITGMEQVVYIGAEAFTDTDFLTQAQKNGSAVVLGDGVLYEYTYMTGDTDPIMPEGIKYVSPYAFDSHGAYHTITFQDGLIGLWEYAMASVNTVDEGGLHTVNLPDSVEFIGDNAFDRCTTLENITIPDTITSIGRNALRDTAFVAQCEEEFLILGDGVLYAYLGESDEIVVPEGVKYLSGSSFEYAMSATSITLPSTLIEIDPSAGYCCYKITELVIPDSVKSIGEKAFSGCTNLTELDLGEGVEYIGYGAFTCSYNPSSTASNSHLHSVILPDSLVEMEGPSFGYYLDDIQTEYKPAVYALSDNFAVAASWGSIGAAYALENGVVLYWLVDVETVLGDVNLDGTITDLDAALLQAALLNRTVLDATQCAYADMDGNAELDAFDLSILKRELLNS